MAYDIEQKSFDLQISVIKSAKNQSLLQRNAGQLSDTDAKSAESTNKKKREKHWLKTLRGSIEAIEASEKNYWPERSFDDLKLANQKSYDKELALLNEAVKL
jgi:hypothetical protein